MTAQMTLQVVEIEIRMECSHFVPAFSVSDRMMFLTKVQTFFLS